MGFYIQYKFNRPVGFLENRIRSLREQCEMKGEWIATILDVTRSYYYKMESGKHPFNDRHLAVLADIFNVPIEELQDLRTMDNIVKASGYYKNPDRPEKAISLIRKVNEYFERNNSL